jgi:hypothetical protein
VTVGIDLHVHSTASDGECAPAEVVRRAASAGVTTMALTDHDTTDGVPEAVAAGANLGVRVIAGCEFSVKMSWGEMHLLAYFLPVGEPVLERFLEAQRESRDSRMREVVRRLATLGVKVTEADVRREAGTGALGRPHVARALVKVGAARDVQDAFDKLLGMGRPAYVAKDLPALDRVTQLVRAVGGVTSAAHLKDRVSPAVLGRLRAAGVDGIEARHPSHDERTADRAEALALGLGLLPTGGSDWHGDAQAGDTRAGLGEVSIPAAWLAALERVHAHRLAEVAS